MKLTVLYFRIGFQFDQMWNQIFVSIQNGEMQRRSPEGVFVEATAVEG